MLVARQLTTTKGQMCRTCARDKWLSESLLTFFFGWWGMISFVVNIFCVLNALAQIPTVFSIPASDEGDEREQSSGALLKLGVVGVCLAMAGAGIVFASGGKSRRLTELEKRTATARTERELSKFTACDLVEAQLLAGKVGDRTVATFGCAGPLHVDGAQAMLEGVTTREGAVPFSMCLERGPQRWFVSTVGGCAKAELNTDISLSIDQQEDVWRLAQAEALVRERRAGLDATLAKLEKQLDEDEETVPLCSSEVLAGYEKSSAWRVPTIDAFALAAPHQGRGGDLGFLTSSDVTSALSAAGGTTESRLEAIAKLEQTKLVAVVARHASVSAPKLTGTRDYESGMFLGRIYLADLTEGRAVCSKVLVFQSGKDISIITTRRTSELTKESMFRSKLKSDFESQYVAALRKAVEGAFKPEAQALADDRAQLQGLFSALGGDEAGGIVAE
ncbi:MAG: hypothetical protein JNK82_39985 [Myxococcaceae bacterium]|nr:hypothetical protein [Myxococcaceae bacterium]